MGYLIIFKVYLAKDPEVLCIGGGQHSMAQCLSVLHSTILNHDTKALRQPEQKP